MSTIDGQTIRRVLLEVIHSHRDSLANLNASYILKKAAERLQVGEHTDVGFALLALWHDLFRNGQLAWGSRISNPDPPFFHITESGRKTLEHLSRDPANPDGYLAHISKCGRLNDIAKSYLKESLNAYNSSCYKATAVLVGGAAESIVLELRDALVAQISALQRQVPKKLEDWRIKTVLDSLKNELDAQKGNMPRELVEPYESHWPSFTQQIRAARNDVGHPSNIDPVSADSVHASLLIFPELMKITYELISWIPQGFK